MRCECAVNGLRNRAHRRRLLRTLLRPLGELGLAVVNLRLAHDGERLALGLVLGLMSS